MSAAEQQPDVRRRDATVRATQASDVDAVSRMLARAFFDDPVMMFFLPDDAARPAKLTRVFKLLHKLALPHKSCFTTEGVECATLWRPPSQWHVHWWQYIANGPEMLGIFGGGALNVMNTMDRIEKMHPKEPHWYLQVIGTDPPKQGKGYAGLAMRERLAVADAAHAPCYLESSKDTNIPVYRSFGFEVTGEIKIPDGPTLWPMWRTAR
jgi:GNAT superfamily N-acetyltransferase